MKSKKLRKFKLGLKQIIVETITGLLTSLILSLLADAGWLPDNIRLYVNIFLIIGNILLVKSMLSWGVFYTVGWLIGSIFFYRIGLFGTGIWDFILYIVLPAAVLVCRLTIGIKRSLTI
jgi:hypothetical protein